MGYSAAALIGASYAIYSGEEGAKRQRQGLRRQDAAQKLALSEKDAADMRNQMALNRVNRKKPSLQGTADLASDGRDFLGPFLGPTPPEPFRLRDRSLQTPLGG